VNLLGDGYALADLTYVADGLPRVGAAVLVSIDLSPGAQKHFAYRRVWRAKAPPAQFG
jgi:hypothetical protein